MPRVVEGKAPVKAGRKIFFKANKGEVRITAAKAGEVSWRVEFSPDEAGSLLLHGSAPTEKIYDACKVEFDASALSAKVCVTASVNAGTVTNSRDFDCASVGATLHGHSGVIKVK